MRPCRRAGFGRIRGERRTSPPDRSSAAHNNLTRTAGRPCTSQRSVRLGRIGHVRGTDSQQHELGVEVESALSARHIGAPPAPVYFLRYRWCRRPRAPLRWHPPPPLPPAAFPAIPALPPFRQCSSCPRRRSRSPFPPQPDPPAPAIAAAVPPTPAPLPESSNRSPTSAGARCSATPPHDRIGDVITRYSDGPRMAHRKTVSRPPPESNYVNRPSNERHDGAGLADERRWLCAKR